MFASITRVTEPTQPQRLPLPSIAINCYVLGPLIGMFGVFLYMNGIRFGCLGCQVPTGTFGWVQWHLYAGGFLFLLGMMFLGVAMVLTGVTRVAERQLAALTA